MQNERKIKLLKYLYPTEKTRQFMCNDLNEELRLIIPSRFCFSSSNVNNKKRKENLQKVQEIINRFMLENKIYKKIISEMYKTEDIEEINNIVLTSFVFYLSNILPRYYETDIFKDKRSICFAPISFIDII